MTQRRWRWQKTWTWILACTFLILWGCGGKPPQGVLRPPPIPEQKQLPVDYLFVIDNSGSIPEEQRDFVREVIQLFVEMTDPGDRVALLAFDEEARLLANRILQGQQDRDFIQEQAEKGLSFRGGVYGYLPALSLRGGPLGRTLPRRGLLPGHDPDERWEAGAQAPP